MPFALAADRAQRIGATVRGVGQRDLRDGDGAGQSGRARRAAARRVPRFLWRSLGTDRHRRSASSAMCWAPNGGASVSGARSRRTGSTRNDYAAVAVTHVDTSTGAEAPDRRSTRRFSMDATEHVILDGVCATAGHRRALRRLEPGRPAHWRAEGVRRAARRGHPAGLAAGAWKRAAIARRSRPTTRTGFAGCRSWVTRRSTSRPHR